MYGKLPCDKKEDALAQLEIATATINQVFNELLSRADEPYVDTQAYISRLFSCTIQAVLSKTFPFQDEFDVKVAIEFYKSKMSDALDLIRQRNNKNSTRLQNIDVRPRLLQLVKDDNIKELTSFIKETSRRRGILDDLNYALRNAAHHNAVKCITYLANQRFGDILSPGPTSGEIALHIAIRKQHLLSIKALLESVDIHDDYAMDQQLFFGEKPNRPYDLVVKIENLAQRKQIIDVILDVLDHHIAGRRISFEAKSTLLELLLLPTHSTPMTPPVIATSRYTLFGNDDKQTLKAVLERRDDSELLRWLQSNADSTDLNYALRFIASFPVKSNSSIPLVRRASPFGFIPEKSISFLLSMTSSSTGEPPKVNLIATATLLPNKPSSGQIAMHRAIRSANVLIVGYLLNETINPSNDLLRQLIIPDSESLRPIDYIQDLDLNSLIFICGHIHSAIEKHKDVERYRLSIEECDSITHLLDKVQIERAHII